MGETIRDVVVVGAGYAGMRAALRLAWRAPQLAITLVDPRATFSQRVRLHQLACGQSVAAPSLAHWCARAGINFVQARARGLDRRRAILQTDGSELHYDRLVLALGSTAELTTPGAHDHAYSIAHEAGARALASRLQALPAGARVAVVGGGLTGIEAACEIAEGFGQLSVQLLTRATLGEGALAPGGRARVLRAFARLGVALREGFEVVAVEPGRVLGTQGAEAVDACVWSSGFRATPWAREVGLPTGALDRLRVDRTLRCIDDPHIYGIGDAAAPEPARGAPSLMSCRLALPMAGVAADNLAGELHGRTPRSFTAIDAGRCISLGRELGVVQLHRTDGRLRDASLGGTAAAWTKERICRFTVWLLEREAAAAARARRRALAPAEVAA